MNKELEEALDKLESVLRKECKNSDICAVEIKYTAQGCEYNFTRRNALAIKKEGISMRNICGQWI